MIAVLVMTDGRRECVERTIESAFDNLIPDRLVPEVWIHDDSGDADYSAWLSDTFKPFRLITAPGRSGFGGAIRSAWAHLRRHSIADYIFHLEDDFTFNKPIRLDQMVDVLDTHPHLVQLALRRQPWNPAEQAAGGIIEQHPDDYTECHDGTLAWLEHRRFFTTNPSLYRRSLIDGFDWPEGDQSEGRFGIRLLRGRPDWRFAFWGSRDSGEWVTHIGHQRSGFGY